MIELRDYQKQGVEDIKAAFRGEKNPRITYRVGHTGPARRVLYVLATGGGKTFTFSYIGERSASMGKRVLIVAHRKELIRQTSLSLGSLGQTHMVVAPPARVNDIRGSHVDKFGEPFIRMASHLAVASVQTLVRRIPWLQSFVPNLLIIDEAHHATAGQWAKTADECPMARILGVTATPCRTDGVGLSEAFDAMVLGPSMKELIAMGNLVPPRVFCPPSDIDLSRVHTRGGDLDADEVAAIVDKPTITGHAVEHYEKLAPGRPAIVFCANVMHAEHVAEQFRESGWKFEVVTGTTDDELRDWRINSLATGELHGIVTVDVVSEGTDIPVAEVAILLRPTDSESLYLQQVGRVLRPAEGKLYGLILDHVGNVKRHGLPHADREWSLEQESRAKRKKSDSGSAVEICPACYTPHEKAPQCPECGYVYTVKKREITVSDGQLTEVVDPEIAAIMELKGRSAQPIFRSMVARGTPPEQAMRIAKSAEEKDRMVKELAVLVQEFIQVYGKGALGFSVTDIKKMTGPQLKDKIACMPMLMEAAKMAVDWSAVTKMKADELSRFMESVAASRFFG